MVARRLRMGLAIQALGVVLFAYLMVRFAGIMPAAAAALSLAALLAAYLLLTLVLFGISWPRSNKAGPGPHPGAVAACRMILAEWLAIFALFAIIQPFADSVFSVKRKRGGNAKLPILLVHGYACNSALWWWMMPRLRAAGFDADAIDLEPPLGSIEGFADQLHRHIEAYLKDCEACELQLVTHSMGGLVARTYLQRYGEARVGKLITLACPHHGTRLAQLGLGQDAREMEPASGFLAALGEHVPVLAVTIWSAADDFIAPQASAHLDGAKEVWLSGLGHLAFVCSRRVLDIVLQELDDRSPPLTHECLGTGEKKRSGPA